MIASLSIIQAGKNTPFIDAGISSIAASSRSKYRICL
jgi:hypothetical protein